MGKRFRIPKPDWSAIIQNLYASIIWWLAGGLFVLIWSWASNFDPLNLVTELGKFTAFLFYFLIVLGVGTTVFLVLKFVHKIWPPKISRIIRTFSRYLDSETKKNKVAGLEMIFLERIKSAPPFLGLRQSQPVISLDAERDLAWYFLAQEFIKTNDRFIRGGNRYLVRRDDDWESISLKIYGNTLYMAQIKADNPGVISLSPGTYISLPYIDISSSLGLSSEQIKKEFSAARASSIEPITKLLMQQFNLIEGQVLPLLKMIYDVAQMTRAEKYK